MYIELEYTPDAGWFVRYAEIWDDHLTSGEALEVVASLIFTGKAPYLRTDLQHALWNLRHGWEQKLITENRSRE
jgi:hypothetical protein